MEKRSFWDTSQPPTYEKLIGWIESHEVQIKRVEDEHQRLLESGAVTEQEYDDSVKKFTADYREYILDMERMIKKYYPDRVSNPVGRPKIGVPRAVKITLPAEDWLVIDEIIASGSASSVPDYFRQLMEKSKNS